MRWMVLILGLFMSGCMVGYQQPSYQGPAPLQATSMAQVDAMVGPQQPAAYKVGFMGGCDSGRLSAGDTSYLFKKDTNRFDTDPAYQQGWDDGFQRCAAEAPVTADHYYYPSYYGYYYPGTIYSGFYYPGYYYAPGYSLWLGYYGHSHHSHYNYSHSYYYSPWRGGHRHRGGHRRFYSNRSNHKKYGGSHYIGKYKAGGHSKGHRGGGKRHKGGGGKGRGHSKRH